jgi:signal transduction histidine kinase
VGSDGAMRQPARPIRMSLARKLSLLTGAVIALSLLIVLGVAYEVLTHSAISGAAEGLVRGSAQLAGVGEAGIRQTRARYSAVAHQPAVRVALARGAMPAKKADDSVAAAAARALETLGTPADSGLTIELWTANGHRIAKLGDREAVVPEVPPDERALGSPRIPHEGIAEVAPVDSVQLGRLYAVGGRVYYWLVQPVLESGHLLGYIAQQRRLAVNPQADRSVRAIAGEGVSIYYRNADGSQWSTVGGSPSSPPTLDPNDRRRATRGNEEVLIAEAPIAGTPLVVAMESRVRDVLAAPRKTLRTLVMVSIAMLIVGMGAALLIGRGVTRPISRIADGAEAIARGEYDTRVPSDGEEEIARLADTFNRMANEIASSQRALEQKTTDAQAANRAKSDFLATVSHELRTPLNAIAGYTELLEMGLRGPLTEPQRRDLARIRASGQHLLGLISGVLDLNRIERGQVSYALTTISVDDFLTDLDALISPQAAAKSLTLEYLPSGRSLTVSADREKLRQIVLNLLSNAIRYTPPGGRIRLSAMAVGTSKVEIAIEDTGPGIPEARREQVFEPFVQLDRSLTQPQEGLGLGLAISRDLARGMDGDLRLASNSSGGATFILVLPRGPSEPLVDVTTSGETAAVRSPV